MYKLIHDGKAGPKAKKVPYYLSGKARRKTDTVADGMELGSFLEACAAVEAGGYGGLGFALGPDGTGNHWQGVDLDDIAEHLGLDQLANELPGYVERSPSGQGVHAICYGERFDPLGANGSGIEAYSYGRFFTVTGEAIRIGPLVCSASFVRDTLALSRGQPPLTCAKPPRVLPEAGETGQIEDLRSALAYIDPDPYGDWIGVGQALVALGESGLALWLAWSAGSPKFNQADAEGKWRTFTGDRTGPGAIFARAQERDWPNPARSFWRDRQILPCVRDRLFTVNGEQIDFSGVHKRDLPLAPAFAPPQPPSASGDRAIMRRVSDVIAKPVRWLWRTRIAVGKLTIIAGDPGLGKSQLATWVAASVTSGAAWPNDEGHAPSGSVIMLSCEDEISDTVRPRLEAASANLDRVYVIEAVETRTGGVRGFNLNDDIWQLEEALKSISEVRLIVIDPITAYMGGTDTHKTGDVRAVLAPLQELASRYNVSILAVSHTNKQAGNGKSVNAVTGSSAFVAASRATFLVTKDAEQPDRLYLTQAKNNLARAEAMAFHIQTCEINGCIKTSRIVFEHGTIALTADEAIQEPRNRGALGDAVAFLTDELANGPTAASELIAGAAALGISQKTLRRAADQAEVVKSKEGYQGQWIWKLPSDGSRGGEMPLKAAQDGQTRRSENAATFGDRWPPLDLN